MFASIMNQNPEIAVTGNSILPNTLWHVQNMKIEEEFTNFPDYDSLNDVIRNIIPNYYSNWKQKYIIDRSSWGLMDYFSLIQRYVQNEIKVIVLVRDVLEVLASFVKFSNENPEFFLNKVGINEEQKCDFLMRNNGKGEIGQVYGQLSGIMNLIRDHNKQFIHIVEYNDLVNDTKNTINGVYNFLNIPLFKHRYINFDQLELNGIKYEDEILGGNLHTIETDKINKRNYKVTDILPENVIEKYKGLNIWRDK